MTGPEDPALIEAMLDTGRVERAGEMLAAALAQQPGSPRLLQLLARQRLLADDAAGALDAADALVSAAPGEPVAHQLRAIALGVLDRHEEAFAAAVESVRLDPLDASTHRSVARAALGARGRLQDGWAAACRAIELEPEEPDSHFLLGVVAESQQQRAVALEAYRRTLALDPEHAAALNNLTLLEDGGLARVALGMTRTLALDPDSEYARRNLDGVLERFCWRVAGAGFLGLVLAADAVDAASEDPTATGTSRLLALVVLAAALIGAVVFRHTLEPVARTYLARRVRRPGRLLALVVLAVGLVLTTGVVGVSPGPGVLVMGVLGPVLGLLAVGLAVWTAVERGRR